MRKWGLGGGEEKKRRSRNRSAGFTLATPTPYPNRMVLGTVLVVSLVIFLLYLGLPYAVRQSSRTPIRPHNTRVLSLGSSSDLATEIGRRITSFHRVPFASRAGDFPCNASRCKNPAQNILNQTGVEYVEMSFRLDIMKGHCWIDVFRIKRPARRFFHIWGLAYPLNQNFAIDAFHAQTAPNPM